MPSDLARRTRPVWQYQAVPALSALLPALPGVSRIGLRSAPTRLLRQPGEEVSHLLRFPAPHGALRLPSATVTCCDRPQAKASHLHSKPQRLTAQTVKLPDPNTNSAPTARTTINAITASPGEAGSAWRCEEPFDHAADLVHGFLVAEPQRGVRGDEHRVDLEGRKVGVRVGDLPGISGVSQFGGDEAAPFPLVADERVTDLPPW